MTWLPLASVKRLSVPGRADAALGVLVLISGGQALAQPPLHTEEGVSDVL